ncbi:MAG: Uma2 family endonuclease [Blautia sp.]|nr:Uma2 family endonuclease [Blautia sp.]
MTIQEMREKKLEFGYSYEEIARLSGIPVSTVRKVFCGITKAPRSETLRNLARVLGGVADPWEGPEQADNDTDSMYGRSTYTENGSNRCRAAGEYRAAGETTGPCPGVAEPSTVYAVQKRQGEYTLTDYLAFPDERRVELIDGVIHDMASPTGFHQLIAGQLYARILSYISSHNGKCLPFISPVDVQLDCDDRTVVQPDVLILCDPGRYTPARIVGAPDFIAEILSPSTRSKDMILKLFKYFKAGVREYWIIDPEKKTVTTWHFEKEAGDAIYTFRDSIQVWIYDGDLVIDFAEIDDYVSPWM